MAIKGTGKVLDGLKTGQLRWPILLLLFLSTVLNYVDRQIFSVLAPYIRHGFDLNNTDYATIVNAFKIGAILGLFVAGPIMDRFGARMGFTLAIVLWTIGGACTGLAVGMFTLMFFRFLLGLGESGNWPAASKAVAEWFPAKERGVAMGFFNGGVSIGAIVAVPLVWFFVTLAGGKTVDREVLVDGVMQVQEVLEPDYAWRTPFFLAALLALPWIFYWLKLYFPPEKHPKISKEEMDLIQADRIKPSGKKTTAVLGKVPFWGLFIARAITSPVWFFVSYWIFNYLHDVHGFHLKGMVAVAWIPFASADVGNILGGYWSGKLVAKGVPPVKARVAMMGIGAFLMGSSIFTIWASHWAVAVTLISLLTFFWGIWVSNMLALTADSFPSKEVGSVMSWTGLGQYGGSFIFMWYIGWALDNLGLGYTPVFVVAALLPIIGFAFTVAMNRAPSDPQMES